MNLVNTRKESGAAVVALQRGKVNAVNRELVEELHMAFTELDQDDSAKGVILTGQGSFFSFGLDVPEILTYSRDETADFLRRFTDLYLRIFLFDRPVIAALNGHTVAAGCMLSNSCDGRIMADGKGKISLNEIALGAAVFAGSVEILKQCVGARNAERILLTGKMYTTTDAQRMGLVDQVVSPHSLMNEAKNALRDLTQHAPPAFSGIKQLIRGPVAETIRQSEETSIQEFLEIWYSEGTQKLLRKVRIH